jgi:MFS transporter, NNP family, nitrate/nitrite transporter
VQFVVPLVITAGRVRRLGGEPQTIVGRPRRSAVAAERRLHLGAVHRRVPPLAAWFGMNDIASAKASFAEQAVIFRRKHNWIMCWLYLGTFGSFIGYSAGFRCSSRRSSPGRRAAYAFLGPLVGALIRPLRRLAVRQARRRARDLLELRR